MNLKKQRIWVGFFFSIFLAVLLQPHYSQGASVEDLRAHIQERNDQIQKLEAEIAGYQKALGQTARESRTLGGEIQRLNTQIKKLNADIRLAEERIAATQLEIAGLGVEINDKEARIKRQKESIASILKIVYQTDATPLAELMLMHPKLSDFFADIANAETLGSSIRAHVAELQNIKTVLQEEKTSQEEKKASLQGLQNSLQDSRRIHEGGKQEREHLLMVTKSKELAYQMLLTDREQKRRAMLDEIQRTEDELRKLIDPRALPAARSGVLSWPIKGAVLLTQSFGSTPDSKILYNGKPHNGIDLKASVGTPIYSAGPGVVRTTGDTDAFPGCLSYGKWVLIDHPNNLSTLYAHLSLIKVGAGDTVTTDSLLGYSGSTGYATGPHLHFTVYDSHTVELKSSSTPGSGCKLLPFGGYVNPLAYL